MIILGDIACPTETLNLNLSRVFKSHSLFHNKSLICNLEGLVCDTVEKDDGKPVLYNHSSVIPTLSEAGVKAVSLANNHILDLPLQFDSTIELLSRHNIRWGGAGKMRDQAAEKVEFDDKGQKVIMFSSCWDFLLYHQENPSDGIYVHTFDEAGLIHDIRQLRQTDQEAKVLVFQHWSFDLETLPFPMYRQWSRDMIDAGADLVVGCHSHCVQGGEKYKDGYIVYGLGNFYLPNGIFAGGKLRFPDFAKVQLAFEYDVNTSEAWCHWFRYHDDNTLAHTGSEKFEESKTLQSYSPYQKMCDKTYLEYFRKNRRKKLLVPVFTDYKQKKFNQFMMMLLKLRAKFARLLAEKKIIKWQN